VSTNSREDPGARTLRNEFFFSAPQLKRDSLGSPSGEALGLRIQTPQRPLVGCRRQCPMPHDQLLIPHRSMRATLLLLARLVFLRLGEDADVLYNRAALRIVVFLVLAVSTVTDVLAIRRGQPWDVILLNSASAPFWWVVHTALLRSFTSIGYRLQTERSEWRHDRFSALLTLTGTAYVPFLLVVLDQSHQFYWPLVVIANLWMTTILAYGLRKAFGLRDLPAVACALGSLVTLFLVQYFTSYLLFLVSVSRI
jgi:hypothetical protein